MAQDVLGETIEDQWDTVHLTPQRRNLLDAIREGKEWATEDKQESEVIEIGPPSNLKDLIVIDVCYEYIDQILKTITICYLLGRQQAQKLFLLGIMEREKKAVYFDGSNTTNRIRVLEEERPYPHRRA